MADEIKPGSFGEIEEIPVDETWGGTDPNYNPEIYFADDLIAIYSAFRDQVYLEFALQERSLL
jgi:hypothetical protein